MNQTLDLVTKEQAVKMKALGFDWLISWSIVPVESFSSNLAFPGIVLPTVALALKWCRSKGRLSDIVRNPNTDDWQICINGTHNSTSYWIRIMEEGLPENLGDILRLNTYEEAESACLDHILKLMENEG